MASEQTREFLLEQAVHIEELLGRGAYRVAWESRSWIVQLWYELRGWNPGGRKGAPSFEDVEAVPLNHTVVGRTRF